jgi:hypothetical protein
MRISINEIIDKNDGKTAFVIGNGPSAARNLKKIIELSKKKSDYTTFVCGEIDILLNNINYDLFLDVMPDYWVMANSIQTVSNYYNNFNKMNLCNGTLIYADSVDKTKNPENYLKIPFHAYDQRNFTDPKRLTIQQELIKYTNSDNTYGSGHTVALHMLAFAVINGCKNIYITGVDLDYSHPYLDGNSRNPDTFSGFQSEIIDDFNTIGKSAKNRGVNIINLSDISPLKNIFHTQEEIK